MMRRFAAAPRLVRAGVRRLSVASAANEAALRAWVGENRAEAVRAVSPPASWSAEGVDLSCLEGYLASRAWSVPAAPEAMPLISHALTYPTTLAKYAEALGLEAGRRATVTVVGARAEASLPSTTWAELLIATTAPHWHVHFTGPELAPNRNVTANVAARRGAKTLRLTCSKGFVDSVDGLMPPRAHDDDDDDDDSDPRSPDAVVLFNPGVGHHALERGWKAALDAIRTAGVPVLFTSHSAHDQRRDLDALAEYYGDLDFVVAPEVNEFRSRKVLADPEDPSHLTSANFGAFVLRPTP